MKISKEFRFEASHILHRHEGQCSRLHGHSWRVLVEVWGAVQQESGFVLDFAKLKELVQPIIDRFDHRHLNCFVQYPSSENIAIHIAHELWYRVCDLLGVKSHLLIPHNPTIASQPEPPQLLSVTPRLRVSVSETQNTWAVWDSNSEYCMAIMLWSNMAAEWRSPHIYLENGTVVNLEELTAQSMELFKQWELVQSKVEQLKMYADSMGKPGAIQEELEGVLGTAHEG